MSEIVSRATGQHELATLGFLLNLLEEKEEFIWHVPLGFFGLRLDRYVMSAELK